MTCSRVSRICCTNSCRDKVSDCRNDERRCATYWSYGAGGNESLKGGNGEGDNFGVSGLRSEKDGVIEWLGRESGFGA